MVAMCVARVAAAHLSHTCQCDLGSLLRPLTFTTAHRVKEELRWPETRIEGILDETTRLGFGAALLEVGQRPVDEAVLRRR